MKERGEECRDGKRENLLATEGGHGRGGARLLEEGAVEARGNRVDHLEAGRSEEKKERGKRRIGGGEVP